MATVHMSQELVKRKRGRPPKHKKPGDAFPTLTLQFSTDSPAELNSSMAVRMGEPDSYTPLMKVQPLPAKRRKRPKAAPLLTPLLDPPRAGRLLPLPKTLDAMAFITGALPTPAKERDPWPRELPHFGFSPTFVPLSFKPAAALMPNLLERLPEKPVFRHQCGFVDDGAFSFRLEVTNGRAALNDARPVLPPVSSLVDDHIVPQTPKNRDGAFQPYAEHDVSFNLTPQFNLMMDSMMGDTPQQRRLLPFIVPDPLPRPGTTPQAMDTLELLGRQEPLLQLPPSDDGDARAALKRVFKTETRY